LTVKQATTTAIPGSQGQLKPWTCNVADERNAIPMLDAAIANQENDVPRTKPISALSASSKIIAVIQPPFRGTCESDDPGTKIIHEKRQYSIKIVVISRHASAKAVANVNFQDSIFRGEC
jgi:hypothetical protein